ncbi:histone-lysine N-methyltransferase SETMAR-like [Vespula maculifrons]|uniref:Histone-lysine N-methyltransferase SETMAR-like n=1 Tax=Vespula maculifrons TaxID=7453 RepID=A0ABD2BPK5_VESMC
MQQPKQQQQICDIYDPRSTMQETADTFGVTWLTVQRHLHKINEVQRGRICISLLTRQRGDPFFSIIVTVDGKSVLHSKLKNINQ